MDEKLYSKSPEKELLENENAGLRSRLLMAEKILQTVHSGEINVLRASEQRVRLATEATGVGIWEWNIITHQIHWDAQMFRIYGITPTADGMVSYKTWSQCILPEDLPQQDAVLKETILQGGHSTHEFRIRRSEEGECRCIQAAETVRTNADGRIEWVVGSNLDVTERKLAETALRESDARMRLFIRPEPKVKTTAFRRSDLSAILTPVLFRGRRDGLPLRKPYGLQDPVSFCFCDEISVSTIER